MTSIVEATSIISGYLEAAGITVDNKSTDRQVESWYQNTDIVDPYMLAAAVLEWGDYRPVSYNSWCFVTDKYFPCAPL